MNRIKLLLLVILGFVGTNALAQTSLSEAVAPGNKVFDFCMKRIGWQYRTEDFWCY